jgi:hypothetical protein
VSRYVRLGWTTQRFDNLVDRVGLSKRSNNSRSGSLNVTKIEEIPRTAWCPYELECLADSHCSIQVTYVKELWRTTKYMMNECVYIGRVPYTPSYTPVYIRVYIQWLFFLPYTILLHFSVYRSVYGHVFSR